MANGAIYCNRCGAQNSSLAKFCANCGTPFPADPVPFPADPGPAVVPDPATVLLRPQSPAWQAPSVPAPVAGRYGGFWIRFVALVIDAILVNLVVLPVAAFVGALIGFAGTAVSMPGMGIHFVSGISGFTLGILANWIYEASLESSTKQATLGKMALGLKVTDLAGRRISFARATGRHFGKFLSAMIFLIGYVMAGFTARKQALHDMIAGTLVVRAS